MILLAEMPTLTNWQTSTVWLKTRDARILRTQNIAQNWPACAALSSIDQMAQKWKNFAHFLAIVLPRSALTTAAARTK